MTDPLSPEELHALIDAKHRNEGWDITTVQADRLLDIAEDHARLVAEVCIRHRCTAHYDVPVQNLNECSGSECGGCIAAQRDTARAENATLLKEREYRFADIEALRAENAKLRERVANLMVAIAPLRIDLPCKCDDDGECQYHAEMLHEVVLAARAALATCNEEAP